MRLTLRNMLASMDEILEPAQQEEIKQKIEESEFATGIMHRIRDVTRRIRLGAPKLTGKGMGLDPNTVSMYLDNTLSAERVPDFEKVCLESDVHLAEVAACHQVLALVLGEPAEINPALRRKLYDIGQTSSGQTGSAAETDAPKVPPPLPKVVRQPGRRERPRVPDYLRNPGRSRWWAVAATILLAVLLAGAVIRAMGPFDRGNPALAWLPIWGEEQVAQNQEAQNGGDDATPIERPEAGVDNQADTQPADVAPADTNQNGSNPNDGAQNNGSAKQPLTDAAGNINAGNINTGSANEAAAASSKAAAIKGAVDPIGKSIPPDGPRLPADDAQAPLPPQPDNTAPAKRANDLTTNRIGAGNTATTPNGDATKSRDAAAADVSTRPGDENVQDATAAPVAAQPIAAQPIGRFLADPNVLLRFNRAGQWERVPQGATLMAGERLLVLPTFRPSITLSAGLTVQLLGETLVELLPPDRNGVPGLRMPFGRMVLMTAGKPDVAVRLSLGGQDGSVTFVDAASTLAAEVRRFLPAGADPEKERAYVAIDLYVPTGEVEWRASENPNPKRIAGPDRVTFGTPYPYALPDEPQLPAWITAEKLSGADELGSDDMNRALSETNERPVALTIRELADHPRKWELNYLGARSLALIGEFEPFIASFSDNDQRSVWQRQIESLQAALARGPETAAMVREAFERQRGADGRRLYEMLWGYSKADIQSGAAAQLVEFLDRDDSLEFRVLAFYALRSIPGVPPDYSGYQPGAGAAQRQPWVRKWREYIKDGPLSPKGALDRPGPAPKNESPPSANSNNTGDADNNDADDESAAIPLTIPILR